MKAEFLSRTYQGCLVRVIQEGAEVIMALTKLWQYGEIATDPTTGIVYHNVKTLLSEFHDLQHAIAAIVNHFKKQHLVGGAARHHSLTGNARFGQLIADISLMNALCTAVFTNEYANVDRLQLLKKFAAVNLQINTLRTIYNVNGHVVAIPTTPVVEVIDA